MSGNLKISLDHQEKRIVFDDTKNENTQFVDQQTLSSEIKRYINPTDRGGIVIKYVPPLVVGGGRKTQKKNKQRRRRQRIQSRRRQRIQSRKHRRTKRITTKKK